MKNFSWKQFLWQFKGPLLTGFFVGTSFIPFPPWALFFCYAPLWVHLWNDVPSTLNRKLPTTLPTTLQTSLHIMMQPTMQLKSQLKRVFFAGWLSQFVFTIIGFNWVSYLVKEFAGFPWPIALVTLVLFASTIHLYVPLSACFVSFLRHRFQLGLWSTLILQALFLSLAERLWPTIFPWHLGYPLYGANLPWAQWADTIGFFGLSTVVLLSNALLAGIWIERRRDMVVQTTLIRHLTLGFCFVLFLVLTWIGGQNRKSEWLVTDSDSKIQFTVIQGNIGNSEKIYAEKGMGYQSYIIDKFLGLSEEAIGKTTGPSLLVWPESAFPDYLNSPYLGGAHQRNLIEHLKKMNRVLLTGAYAKDRDLHNPRGPRRSYNGYFLLSPEGLLLDEPYYKTLLVAFSEFFPFSDLFPILLQLPFVSNFGRGMGPKIMHLPATGALPTELFIGAQICYEGLFPEFSAKLSELGAELYVNLTNDSWFGWWSEPYQHLIMTLSRSIETRRPLLRATNTGINAVALASGDRLPLESSIMTEWTGNFDVPFRRHPRQTFYVLYGHYDWVLMVLTIIGILLAGKVRNKSRGS